jgi:circadian clock protein KaiB
MSEAQFVHPACTPPPSLLQIRTDGRLSDWPSRILEFMADDPPEEPYTGFVSDRTMGGPPRARSAGRPGSPKAASDHAADLVLYVSGDSINSIRAVRSLTALMQRYPPDTVRVRIVDVAEDVAAATKDRVLFTPTLIITDSAARTTRLLGSLSNAEVLADLLRTVGIEPA